MHSIENFKHDGKQYAIHCPYINLYNYISICTTSFGTIAGYYQVLPLKHLDMLIVQQNCSSRCDKCSVCRCLL